MKAAMIGDNCIDFYTEYTDFKGNTVHDIKYPTGNVVDTGVNLQKLGIETAIISTTGSDDNGRWMIETLRNQHLDITHLKVGNGSTAITRMTLNGTDRVHGDYEEGVMKDIVFDDEDIRFAATHDLVHSALWGMAENTLPKIKAAGNARISFDYADRLDHPLVEKTLPYVDYGFYSWHRDRDSFIENFLKDKTDRGMKIAVATLGEKGSLAYNGKQFIQCGIVTVQNVINTVGAGDSYIAGFLAGIMRELPLLQCMELGAATASEVIQVFEPWK